MTRWKWVRVLMIGLVAAPLALLGCAGDDGSDGAQGLQGIQGPEGAQGPEGPQGPAGEDATVGIQTLAELGLVYSGDVTAINPVLDLSNTVAYDAATGAVTIHFFLTDENGDGIDVTKIPYELRIYASELLPADPSVTVNPGPAWTQLFSESGTPATSPMPGTLTLVDAVSGEYTYLCSNTVAATDNVIRLTVRARFRFRDSNNQYIVVANPVNASYDFLEADPGTALASSGADMVTTAACESCHGARIGNVGHGGGYTQVKTCNHCHNVNYMATRDLQADLAFMIHRIHDAGVFDELGDFSEVTYPQHIYTCGKCHDGPNASLAYATPTRSNCGSCHDNVDFDTGAGHGPNDIAGPQQDAACHLCHLPAAVEGAHDPDAVAPAYAAAIGMTPPADGTAYAEGETPVVTVTVTDASGNEIDYTADPLPVNRVRVYVYGPRAEAVPVLTYHSTTDTSFYVADPVTGLYPTPAQAHDILAPAADETNASVDADGFHYQLMAIPADLAPGTYMVLAYVRDTSNVSYYQLINFQVGTDEVEPKVSGDACYNCHVPGTMGHRDEFGTDGCLACHDKSGNHADYIGNRVHAIHRATATGDLNNRNWSEVTFPQPANNCTVCHTNASADTPVWRTPDMVACGGCHGAMPDAVPADYPTVDADRIRMEAGAAQHMVQNGGSTDPTVTPTLQCLVCHGEGRTADLYETHQLIQFRALPADPNE